MPTPPQPGVLVVEDGHAARALLKAYLQQCGFAVYVADDGAEALEVYRQHRRAIAVALLDVRMPGLDGPQTLAALHALAPGLPCCFMTGQDGTRTDEELLALGAAHVFHKPFPRVAEVARVLARLALPPAPGGDGLS